MYGQINQISSKSQLPASIFEPYQNIDNQFPPSRYVEFENNYSIGLKDLEERKKWHLSEASRLCAEMN